MYILLILLLLFSSAAEAADPLVPDPVPFQVHLFPYRLKMDGEPLQAGRKIGRLVFQDAVELKSETYRFGGFSSLSIVKNKLHAMSDEGRLLRAALQIEGNKITALSDASLDPLWPPGEEPIKADYDSEALTHLKGEQFVVGFEQQHRIGLYRFGKKILQEKIIPAPETMRRVANPNEGIEALAEIAPSRLLALTESAKNPAGNTLGYIINLKNGKWQPLSIEVTSDFHPTDIAIWNSRYLLLLERSYSPLQGMEARISLIDRKSVWPGAVLKTTELARFGNNSGIDNMEGIAVLQKPDGTKNILLISDDNFNPLQETILVLLAFPDRPISPPTPTAGGRPNK